MIADALDFPCVEASRCYLTEKEHGLRLSLIPSAKAPHEVESVYLKENTDAFKLVFSKNRSKQEEWYVHLDTISVPAEEDSDSSTGTMMIRRRVLKFCHVATGHYLYSTHGGHVGVQPSSHDWDTYQTIWRMEPAPVLSSFGGSSSYSDTQDDDFNFSLVSMAHAPRKLASGQCNGFSLTTTEDQESFVWEIEFTSGELLFVTNPILHSQIRCNVFGKLSLNKKREGWEVWRFIEVGNGHLVISSWTHSHKFLSSNSDGEVYTTENRLGTWEQWKVERSPHGLYIRSVAHSGRYLSAGYKVFSMASLAENEDVLYTTTKPGGCCVWHLDAAHSHVYFLSILTNSPQRQKLHVSSNRHGPFVTKNQSYREEWRMQRDPRGYITLWSMADQKYLGSSTKGEVLTTSSKGNWSLWEMEVSNYGSGEMYLKSKATQRLLTLDHDEMTGKYKFKLSTVEDRFSLQETWRLDPRLPTSLSGPKLAALGAAGAVGVALTVTMPYATLGIVEAAGMTATRLAVGFTVEALAGFGGGALLGASIVGTTAAMVEKDCKEQQQSLATETKADYFLSKGSNRPISSWRNWKGSDQTFSIV